MAAVVAARALVDDGEQILGEDACLQLANELEGHPDNVAACLRGGVTFAWLQDDGSPRAVRLDAHTDLAPVAFVPATRSSTAAVRGLLPATVPYADAIHNAARAALLAHALTVDPSLLLAATADRLHQDYRAPAMPETARLVARLRGRGVPAVVSGAGPTVLALTMKATQPGLLSTEEPGWSARPLDVAVPGAQVVA